jgi:hypothetical protein
MVLAPLEAHLEENIRHQSTGPQVIRFADSLSAAVFTPLVQRLGFQVTGPGVGPLCPWSKATGTHGYSIRLVVDTLSEKNASARYEVTCSQPEFRGRRYATWTTVRLERDRRKWVAREVIGYGKT